MRSISIYALTRNQNTDSLSKLERQLSGREYFLKIREWELQSMKALVRQLESHMTKVCSLRFFYSYQIPKLGKEFDLLQIKDDQIINIELKSGAVSEEAIRKQLMQNRYYLSVLGRSIQSYTYISSQNRLVRLTNHDHIAEADWTELCGSLQKESSDYQGNIDDLFQAELYLISPITELSRRQQICMIHCGNAGKEWKILHKRLQRIAFLSDNQLTENTELKHYSAVLVDEAHLLSSEKLQILLTQSEGEFPVIFSSDSEDAICPEELGVNTLKLIENLPEIQMFHLTNRIRTNAELSSFIQNMIHLTDRKTSKPYPHVSVVYANNEEETAALLEDYIHQGYEYEITAVRDIKRLVIILDERYYYDQNRYLRSKHFKEGRSDVRNLFHWLNQAKEELSIIVSQ